MRYSIYLQYHIIRKKFSLMAASGSGVGSVTVVRHHNFSISPSRILVLENVYIELMVSFVSLAITHIQTISI